MYKIAKRVDDGYPLVAMRQVIGFLKQTANFGKKFYTLEGNSQEVDEKEKWYLTIYAVGISRDIVYELHWVMACHRDLALNSTHESFLLGKTPLYGLIPWHEDVERFFYPILDDPKASPEHNSMYVDLFQYHNFVLVDFIEEQ